jgi:hypothetical protein
MTSTIVIHDPGDLNIEIDAGDGYARKIELDPDCRKLAGSFDTNTAFYSLEFSVTPTPTYTLKNEDMEVITVQLDAQKTNVHIVTDQAWWSLPELELLKECIRHLVNAYNVTRIEIVRQ